ncbi:phage tail tape measure protein [Clostridium sp.]|uniref:phage tail tape measure protein n=1 Tax=Clostridium sp. TaxID=1506 RepID=UPI001D324A05|nr:phage tail tape measure protein [Clostridium sp.]MBS5307791.1 phage tail tape measure protein [Clostridium sp.]
MAQQNGFNAMWGVTFEDFNSVKKKLDILTKQINTETSRGIKLGIDNEQITRTISDLSKLAKQNIQILPDGQITTLSKFNQELGKTISLKKNLTTGDETLSLSVDNDKIRKDTEKMYSDLFKQKEEMSAIQQKMSQQSRQQLEQEAKESNRILEEKYKAEQEFINTSQSLKQKSSQQSLRQAQEEAKINNQLLESKYKDSENKKQELADAQKLIAYEKQRLELRLKGIETNRKGLTNENYADRISEGISNLNGKNTAEVKERVKQLNLELQKLDQNARMKGLQVGNKNIMSLGESIKSTATKLGIFVSTAMVLNEVQRTIRNATSYIIELDKSMVNLRKVTDETSDTYDRFLNRMHNVALELGTQSNLMVDATTNWAKTGKNLEEASKLAENTILLTKVGDIDNVDTAQQYMVAPLKAFNIEAEKSITLIDKYNNISNNMATQTRDVGEGLNIASNSLAVARNSLEQSIALIATAESTTKAGGSVIGNALKTISLRLATFKDDETGELIPTMAEDLKQLGVSAVDSAGQIRSTFDIMRDLGGIYKDLDTNMQLKLSEMLGGKRQANIVASILMNVDELDRAYGLATNSAGSAMVEFEKYQDGIEYSLDQLKEQVNGLYTSFLNGGFFKGLVDGASDVISIINNINGTFGTMPTVITTVVGAMTIFNTKFRETTQTLLGLNPALSKVFVSLNNSSKIFSQQSQMYAKQISFVKDLARVSQEAGVSTSGFGKELINLNAKLAMSTLKLVGTKLAVIALESAITMGLSFAVSFVINKLGEFIDKIVITKDELRELNSDSMTAMQGNRELVSSVEELIKKEEELKDKLSSKGNTYEEQKQYRTELLNVSRQIADILPESANAFDEEGNRISTNTEKILENLDAKKKLAESEAIKAIENNSDYDTIIKAPQEYEKMKKQLSDMKEAYKNNQLYMDSEVDSKWLEKIEKKVNEYEEAIKIMSASVESLRTAGWSEDRIAQEIFKNMPTETAVQRYQQLVGVTDRYNQSLQVVNENQQEFNDEQNKTNVQSKGVEDLQKTYEKLGYSIGDAKKKVEELNSLSINDKNAQILSDSTKAYSEAIGKTKELETIMNEINETQSMTPELIMSIIDMYPEIGSRVLSVADTQEFLNKKIGESVDSQRNAYVQMVANDSNYYTSKIKNNEGVQDNFNKLLSAFVTNSGRAYSADLSNYNDLNQLKSELTAEYGSVVAELITNFVASNADGYDIDLDNTVSWASSKGKILRDLSNQIVKVERQLANHLSNITKATGDGNTLEDEKLYARAKNELANLNTQKEEIMTEFYKYNSGFAGYTPTFTGSDFKGSDGSKGSSATEKEVGDLEDLTNRYHDLEDAVNDYSNALKINKLLQENSTGANKINLMKEELGLYQKQAEAVKKLNEEQKREANELKSMLAKQGVSFDNKGDIGNYNAILTSKRNWANSLSGDAKESAKEQVKALAEQLKRYDELVNKLIPAQEDEWQSLNNTIKEVYKTQAKLVADQEKQIYDTVKYFAERATEAKKKEIDKQIELLNKSYDDENKDENLNKQRQKVTELMNEMAKYENSVDAKGKARYQQLVEEYEAQQSELNNIIKESQKEFILSSMEKEKEKLDEELEDLLSPANMNKLIADALNSGMVEIGGEVVDLQKAMTSMLSETTIGTQTLIQTNNEWIASLKEAISLYSNISGINSNIGLNTSINGLNGARGVDSRTFNINVSVPEVAGGVTGDDVSKAITKALKDYDSKFK